jgi:hypothetical protein
MKRILNAVWNFLEAWGQHRYQLAKRRNFLY